MYYGDDRTMKEIVKSLRVHESRISQRRRAALNKLRSILCRDGYYADEFTRRNSNIACQAPPCKRSKYLLTVSKSSSVSTPVVSYGVSAT